MFCYVVLLLLNKPDRIEIAASADCLMYKLVGTEIERNVDRTRKCGGNRA